MDKNWDPNRSYVKPSPSWIDLDHEANEACFAKQGTDFLRARHSLRPSTGGTHLMERPKTPGESVKALRALLTKMLGDPSKKKGSDSSTSVDVDKLHCLHPSFDTLLETNFIQTQIEADKKAGQLKRLVLPPTPKYYSDSVRLDNADSKIRKFRRNLGMKGYKTTAEQLHQKALKEKAEADKKKHRIMKKRFYPKVYDAELSKILSKQDMERIMPKFQREKLKSNLVKRDELIAQQLESVRQTKRELIDRNTRFSKVLHHQTRKLGVVPGKYKASFPGGGSSSGFNSTRGRRPSSGRSTNTGRSSFGRGGRVSATFGSKTSTTSSWLGPQPSRKVTDLVVSSSSGYVAGDDDDGSSDFDLGAGDDIPLGLVKNGKATYGQLLRFRNEFLKTEKTRLMEKAKRVREPKTRQKTPVKFIKKPSKEIFISSGTSSDEKQDRWKLAMEDDRRFLKELRDTVYINPGHCALTTVPEAKSVDIIYAANSGWLPGEPQYDPLRPIGGTGPLSDVLLQLGLEEPAENYQLYPEVGSIFPRESFVPMSNPEHPYFWTGFHFNKYCVEDVVARSRKPEYGPFFRQLFHLDRMHNADPDDPDPAVIYFNRVPSELGLLDMADPDPDEMIPKPHPNKSIFQLIPNNSPASSDSFLSFGRRGESDGSDADDDYDKSEEDRKAARKRIRDKKMKKRYGSVAKH